jgi:hypothetical protein
MTNTNSRDPKRAGLYARVSTDEQGRHGYSLAQQLEALREYADREGYEVLEESRCRWAPLRGGPDAGEGDTRRAVPRRPTTSIMGSPGMLTGSHLRTPAWWSTITGRQPYRGSPQKEGGHALRRVGLFLSVGPP